MLKLRLLWLRMLRLRMLWPRMLRLRMQRFRILRIRMLKLKLPKIRLMSDVDVCRTQKQEVTEIRAGLHDDKLTEMYAEIQ